MFINVMKTATLALLAGLSVCAVLASCTPQQMEMIDTTIPAIESAASIAFPGIAPILTAAESSACAAQTAANAVQPPTTASAQASAISGIGCTW